jgi:hypothetical protein
VKLARPAINAVDIDSLVPKQERTPPRVASRGRTVVPFRVMVPKKRALRIGRLVQTFAVVAALLLFAVSARVGWNVGKKTPPFDMLFADVTEASAESATLLPAAPAENSPETAANNVATRIATLDLPQSQRESASGSDVAAIAPPRVPGGPKSVVRDAAEASSVVAGLSDNDRILTVAIEKDSTLMDLCMQHLGHFDTDMLEQTLALNPMLSDVNHIPAGRRIRLPLYLRRGFVSQSEALEMPATLEAHKERP